MATEVEITQTEPATMVIELPQMQTYELGEASAEIRWVDRNGERTLQQRWIIKTYNADNRAIAMRTEWHDVPVERA